MVERNGGCTYSVVARINGVKKVIICDPSKGCLHDMVWDGRGVTRAGAAMAEVPAESVTEAHIEGQFSPCPSLAVTSKK